MGWKCRGAGEGAGDGAAGEGGVGAGGEARGQVGAVEREVCFCGTGARKSLA